MFVAVSGSLPAHSINQNYPFSHISYWGDRLVSLGYDVVGTGEPGWTRQYRMVERFTQDIRGIEIRRVGHQFKSYCAGRILAPENPDEVKEVLENAYLREILKGCGVRLKATITDPVTVGLQLIANDPSVLRRYSEIFSEVATAMTPIVERMGQIADIVQFDCPTHLYKPTKNPWQYVNQLAESVAGKPTWLHLDGPSQKFFRNLLCEYNVDVLILNLFGSEESENFEALKENYREIMKHDKKVGLSVINTQIPDEEQNLESEETVLLRLTRLSKILKGDTSLIETIMPGCGLNILPNTSPQILELLPRIVRGSDW
jgi:methionine synthase II (cobalamin-independent)